MEIFFSKNEQAGKVKSLFKGPIHKAANGTVFFDQLHRLPKMTEDDSSAYKILFAKHFPDANIAWWPRENPIAVQAFVRDWCRNQALELVGVTEYERPSDGYFEWRLDYAIPHGRWE